jgi:NADPH:quinone reductase-like Zn-dependent oxidoreductase
VAYHSVFDYRRALKPTGVFIIVGGSLGTFLQVVILGALISKMGSRKLGINAYDPNNKADLAFLAELFGSGDVVPIIDRYYPLSEVPEALRYLEEGRVQGKLVITM